MRKSALTILFLAVIAYSGYAQGGPTIGIKGGYGPTYLLNKNWKNDKGMRYMPSFGYNAGLALGYNARYYNFGFSGEVFIQQIRHKMEEDRATPTFSRDYKFQYLSLPLFLRLRPSGDYSSRTYTYGGAYFEIGVQPSKLLSATLDSFVQATGTTQIDIKNRYEEWNVFGVIGAGFHQVGTEKISLTHGIRVYYGFMDMNNEANRGDYINVDGTTSSYQSTKAVTVQYLFSLIYKFGAKGRRG